MVLFRSLKVVLFRPLFDQTVKLLRPKQIHVDPIRSKNSEHQIDHILGRTSMYPDLGLAQLTLTINIYNITFLVLKL